MGKARLEELKKANERSPGWYDIKESPDKCPICGGKLFSSNSHHLVMDGNTVYHCDQQDDHTFWRNARDTGHILYLNEMADESNFDWEVEYRKNDAGEWEVKTTKTYSLAEIKEALSTCQIFKVTLQPNPDNEASKYDTSTVELWRFFNNMKRLSKNK